jgi:DNA-binding HxlR family transcriptional regulator
MARLKYTEHDCSIARTLQVVGEHWSMLIVKNSFYGTTRFSDFQRLLGVARNILTDRLNHLVEAGIMEKYVAREGGVRQHYRLTAKGRDLLPILMAMMQWGDRWTAGDNGAPVIAIDRQTGLPIDTIKITTRQGMVLDFENVDYVANPGQMARAA